MNNVEINTLIRDSLCHNAMNPSEQFTDEFYDKYIHKVSVKMENPSIYLANVVYNLSEFAETKGEGIIFGKNRKDYKLISRIWTDFFERVRRIDECIPELFCSTSEDNTKIAVAEVKWACWGLMDALHHFIEYARWEHLRRATILQKLLHLPQILSLSKYYDTVGEDIFKKQETVS